MFGKRAYEVYLLSAQNKSRKDMSHCACVFLFENFVCVIEERVAEEGEVRMSGYESKNRREGLGVNFIHTQDS